MKTLCYFLILQIGLFLAFRLSFKTLQEFKTQEWVSEDSVRDTHIKQFQTYAWTFGLATVVLAGMFSTWLATEFLPHYQKFDVLKWLFHPVAVGFITVYVVIFDSPKIYSLLKDKETRNTAMQHPIMRTPTPMRVFWVGSGIGLATFGVATMMMLEFLN